MNSNYSILPPLDVNTWPPTNELEWIFIGQTWTPELIRQRALDYGGILVEESLSYEGNHLFTGYTYWAATIRRYYYEVGESP